METINLDEIQPLLDQDPPPEPKKEKKPVTKKKPAPKKERRGKKEILALVEKINARVAAGESATSACEAMNLNYQTYRRYATGATASAPTGDVSEIGKAVADFQKAAERLRKLGATFTVSKIKFDISV